MPPKDDPATPRSEAVMIRNGEITLAGTLTLPEGAGPFPAVALLSGDGQQDRDWTLGKLKMAKIVADGFAKSGVAVLRHDDRGEGGSSGGSETQASYRDRCGDALAAMRLLRARADIGAVGLLGHSGGASIAVMTAAAHTNAADFIITLSGPYVSGEQVMIDQAHSMPGIYRGAATQPDAEATREGERIVHQVATAIRTGSGFEDIRVAWGQVLRERYRTMPEAKRARLPKELGSEEDFLKAALADILGDYQSPLERDFILYDPAADIPKVTCPLLVLFGEKDQHVSVALHRPPLMRALVSNQSADITVRIVPGADHAYTSGEQYQRGEMLPGVVPCISGWVRNRF